MKRTVENDEFEKALQNNDYINIMNNASKRFKNQIDKDSLKSCHMNALWKALAAFDPDRNVKFTTFLHKGVFIECMKEIKILNKSKIFNKKLHNNLPQNFKHEEILELQDELDNKEDFDLLVDRFVGNMTINELAKSRNINREKIRKKIHSLVAKLKSGRV